MKNITIRSSHKSVTEAVAASGLDFSYNFQAAADEARDLDRGYRGHGRFVLRPTTEAFVADVDGKADVIYALECEEKGGVIRFLHTFSPFSSCLSGDPFVVLERTGLTFREVAALPKIDSVRQLLAKTCVANPAVYVT